MPGLVGLTYERNYGAAFSSLQGQQWLFAIIFAVFFLILQQIEGNLIYPKVVGKAVGLPGIIVVSAVLVGGNIGGVLGALIAVPTCAVIYTLLCELIDEFIRIKDGIITKEETK